MGEFKPKQLEKSELLHLESEMNSLWGELNTATIAHNKRLELESKLAGCEEQFKAVMSGQAPLDQLNIDLSSVDYDLALAAIEQAEQEIPKAEHTESAFLALEELKKELQTKVTKPLKVRHEVKAIIRRHV